MISAGASTAIIGIVGIAVGAILGHLSGRAADRRRLKAEDDRRWQTDRRAVYARFLSLAEELEREADGIACSLPYDETNPPLSSGDDEYIREASSQWITRWNGEVLPLLSEVELLATPDLADLAARTAHGLLSEVPQLQHLPNGDTRIVPALFSEHVPVSFQVRDLIGRLRNGMRRELGLPEIGNRATGDDLWPWFSSSE